ncbi:hypothetical protein BXZ70DRAFT_979653 [Cristinia sonorae]|uniref:F-box domain-containing protein n=1 Tax=Cristinia sonorae TaxID=1940300 RepID=A0A8K0UGG2_9AGAR|nr:hypothetical protein BXZ70DRAFT_979653 [Cristinia sonorae]
MEPPALSLPPEILSEIFLIYNDIPFYLHDLKADDPPPWLIITSVCRYWREVALNTALLWNVIDVERSFELIELFLARSAGAPLDIYGNNTQDSDVENYLDTLNYWDTLPLILTEIGRIRKLDIDLTLEMREAFESTPWDTANILSVLHLHHFGDEYELLLFLDNLKTPLLREMKISMSPFADGPLPWKNYSLSKSLTHLNISGGSFVQTNPMVVANVIRDLQLLEVLMLDDTFDVPSSLDSPNLNPSRFPVALPHLQQLHLTNTTFTACAPFLEYVKIPSSTLVVMVFDNNDLQPARGADEVMINLLRRRLNPIATTASVGVDILVIGCEFLTFDVSELSRPPPPLDRNPHLCLSYLHDEPDEERLSCFMHLVRNILVGVPLCNITMLSIHFLPQYATAEADWRALAACLPNVIAISVYQDSKYASTGWSWSVEMTVALFKVTPGDDGQPRSVNFPKLKLLCLRNFNVKDTGGTDALDSSFDFVEGLRDAFMRRREAGFEDGFAVRIDIKNCEGVDSGGVRRLEDAAVVVWDGNGSRGL